MENPQVFISYDHRDRDWVVFTLVPKLQKAGLRVRHDSEIHLGTSIYEWIDASRGECKAFIIVISKNYVQNRSYARAEMEDLIIRSLRGHLRVVPVFKETVHDSDVPFGILSLNSIRNLESLDSQLAVLAAQLKGEYAYGVLNTVQTETCFIPPERRLRIQASTKCTQECPWCHWDDFPRSVGTPNYRLVLELMERLKQARDSDHITYPRPNITFALTGGEPLTNQGEDSPGVSWKTLASVDPQNTFLLTNARLLDNQVISFIKATGLKRIRIDLPLIPILGHDFRGIRTKKSYGKLNSYYTVVLDNIAALLNDADAEVRFNYVVTHNNVQQIEDYLNFIRTHFRQYIGNKVSGVAFIEQYPRKDPDLDIFALANQWAGTVRRTLLSDALVQRKTTASTYDGIKIEFIKLNCAASGDLFSRCFACVQEQDIAISADGRIRICSGWDTQNESGCRYVFAHFEPAQPLVGISGAIRRRYGIVGFYSHFGTISNILSGKPVPESLLLPGNQFAPDPLRELAVQCGIHLPAESLRNFAFVPLLAERILGEKPPFRRLYEEGTYDQKHLENSTRLCCLLLRAAYSIASFLANPAAKDASLRASLNGILLLLEYLCVDESLFSTGRTLMVQGMSTDLLKDIAENGISNGFLADSSYCLAAVAFENCDSEVVTQFLTSQVPLEYVREVAWVQYLIGCLHRQSGREDEAIEALELAYSLADAQIRAGSDSRFIWLLREVRAEAKRSLGAIRKGRAHEFELAQKDFALANFLSAIDNTKLAYAALYSDGYASMLRYFHDELGNTPFPKEAYKAHRDFNESITLNPTFYASLIRMGLLEMALGQAEIAAERLRLAKRSFSKRGLLTDQEYLNSILCDLIYIVAADNLSVYAARPQVWSLGVADCRNVGKKDVLCVKEGAEFLLEYINKICDEDKRDTLSQVGVVNELATFILQCNKLAGES